MTDILERAKSLRHYLANKAEWQDESVIVGELISEVERLRSLEILGIYEVQP